MINMYMLCLDFFVADYHWFITVSIVVFVMQVHMVSFSLYASQTYSKIRTVVSQVLTQAQRKRLYYLTGSFRR